MLTHCKKERKGKERKGKGREGKERYKKSQNGYKPVGDMVRSLLTLCDIGVSTFTCIGL